MLYRFRRAKILILLAIFIFPAFFGCSSQSDEYTEHVVEFPASNSKKTGYNSAVYEIEPLNCTLCCLKAGRCGENGGWQTATIPV